MSVLNVSGSVHTKCVHISEHACTLYLLLAHTHSKHEGV